MQTLSTEDAMKLDKFLHTIHDPSKWTVTGAEQVMRIASKYAEILNDDKFFNASVPIIAKYVSPASKARRVDEYFLQYALESKQCRWKVMIQIIQAFVKLDEGTDSTIHRKQATRIISDFLRNGAIDELMIEKIDDSFLPYISATVMKYGNIPKDEMMFPDSIMKAIPSNPDLFGQYESQIEQHFHECNVDDIVKAALSSDRVMKFVLSHSVQLVLDNNTKGHCIIQKLSASTNSEPAISVANYLKEKKGINCLLVSH